MRRGVNYQIWAGARRLRRERRERRWGDAVRLEGDLLG